MSPYEQATEKVREALDDLLAEVGETHAPAVEKLFQAMRHREDVIHRELEQVLRVLTNRVKGT